MRVLHIDAGRELRGGQRQVLMLIQTLRRAGHEQVLLARQRGPLWQEAARLNIELAPLGLIEVLRRSSGAEIVHVHDSHAHTLAALASRRPFVVSRRVAFPVGRGLLSRWKYRRAQRFLAVSEFVAIELTQAGVPRTKIDVVYDGVEPITNEPARDVPQPYSQPFRAVALATRDNQKGRDLVEKAVALAGFPVEYSNDLSRDLPGASAFLYITRSEGLGSAALLAMSLGVPVIASRAGGLPEAVREGQEGLLVENDPAAIKQALMRLAADREFAGKLGASGRRRVAALFTDARLGERTLDSYQRALR